MVDGGGAWAMEKMMEKLYISYIYPDSANCVLGALCPYTIL